MLEALGRPLPGRKPLAPVLICLRQLVGRRHLRRQSGEADLRAFRVLMRELVADLAPARPGAGPLPRRRLRADQPESLPHLRKQLTVTARGLRNGLALAVVETHEMVASGRENQSITRFWTSIGALAPRPASAPMGSTAAADRRRLSVGSSAVGASNALDLPGILGTGRRRIHAQTQEAAHRHPDLPRDPRR